MQIPPDAFGECLSDYIGKSRLSFGAVGCGFKSRPCASFGER